MLWIPVTIGAAVAQTARNALQSGLTGSVGTPGATMVRFVYALPLALLAYGAALAWGQPALGYSATLIGWAVLGAVAQIAATALMLKAMHLRGFGVAYAYIKTEPVMLAVGGWLVLGDSLPLLSWLGIMLATSGVIWAALPREEGFSGLRGEATPMILGVVGGAFFGLSSLAFRAAILTLGDVAPWMAALHVMCFVLVVQSVIMLAWLRLSAPQALRATLAQWRPSLGAGFAGALATLFWFTGFALTAAANVRTLALIEMPLAAFLNRRVSGRALGRREWTGIALVAVGIGLLLRSHV